MPTTTQVEATLNVNAIGARTDFSGTATTDLSAEEIRFDQATFSEGLLKPTDGFQVVAGAGGTMDVIIGSGSAKIDYMVVEGDIPGQGQYVIRLDDVTKTITLSNPDSAQTRVDEIWLVVLDSAYDGGTKSLPIFAVREGDLGAGAPGPDSNWDAHVLLATITVPGGSADITEASIVDERVRTTITIPELVVENEATVGGTDVNATLADHEARITALESA